MVHQAEDSIGREALWLQHDLGLEIFTDGKYRTRLSPHPSPRPAGEGMYETSVYWMTDFGVASMRVTLICSRKSMSGTWGAM